MLGVEDCGPTLLLAQRIVFVGTINRYLHNIFTLLVQLRRHSAGIPPAPEK